MSRRGARRTEPSRTIHPPEVRKAIASRMRAAAKSAQPQVTHVNAGAIGVDRSTLWRWTHQPQGNPGRPRAHRHLPDAVRGVLYEQAGGNVARAYRLLAESELVTCSESTFRRQVAAIPAPEHVYALQGSAAMRHQTTTTLPFTSAHRNQRWQIDHRELDLFVIPPAPGTKPVRPWVTSVLDDATRAVLAVAVSLQPNSTVAAQALAAAIAEHPAGLNPFCGLPSEVIVDNGSDFTSEHFTQVAARLGVVVTLCRPYVPQHKGKVERWHETMDQLALRGLPGDTRGPRLLNGELRADGRELLLYEELPAILEQLLVTYHGRTHSSLGCTPREAWDADPTSLRTLDAPDLAPLLLREDTRIVGREGVQVSVYRTSQHYTAPEIATRRGDTVRIGYLPHDDRQVWIYETTGELICVAKPARQLTDDERLEFTRHRQKEVADFKRRARDARTAGRAHYDALLAAGQQATILGLPAPDEPTRRPRRRHAGGIETPVTLALAFGPTPEVPQP